MSIKPGIVVIAAALLARAVGAFTALAPDVSPANRTIAGPLIVEPATLHCLGFAWPITGDDNRNGAVAVSYRKQGENTWRQALPLLRVHHEIASETFPEQYDCGNLYAGIMDLPPGTRYEVRFALTDPDGGSAARSVIATTRPEPRVFAGGLTLHVYPPDYRGTRHYPAFTGLRSAYAAVQAGDLLLVHRGVYTVAKERQLRVPLPLRVSTKGGAPAPQVCRADYLLDRHASAARPIVIRGAGDGEALFEGDGVDAVFVVKADYHFIEGLTIQDSQGYVDGNEPLAYGGLIYAPGDIEGLVVRRCTLRNATYGVFATQGRNRYCVITDNRILGRNRWWEGQSGTPDWTHGIWIRGQGHSVGYNLVQGWWDGIDHGGYYSVPKDPALQSCDIDFYNNDIRECQDDFVETDYVVRNMRVLRNRGTNSGTAGYSVQPAFGGPVYLIRNTVYNVLRGIGLKIEKTACGMLVYNNTICSPLVDGQFWRNGHFRNNLFMGAVQTGTWTPYSSMDYDGFWARPRNPAGVNPRDFTPYAISFSQGGQFPIRALKQYATLADFTAATGYEAHGIQVDYGIFANVQPHAWLDAPPKTPQLMYDPAAMDFQLRAGAAGIDAGCVLPDVTDGFQGKAPDLGALEFGSPVPHYGPRGSTGGER